ncbi:MAG TPA: nuclear transport factor 2 family protein [Opitutaceae bacterium]|nr:nuclear transport factor 2 family protein [Opitutaceae bacterium]
MNTLTRAACAATLMTAASVASSETREEALATLVAAERAFAQVSLDSGYKAAFLGVLAADSTLFQPDPVNGREVVSASEDPPFILSWYPVTADIAASGDLGFTTGPYTVKPKDPAETRRGSGHYTSVWRRLPTGAWELIVDLGTRHPTAATPPAGWKRPAGSIPLAAAVSNEERVRLQEALRSRDAALGNPREGETFLAALARFAEPAAWIYRPGSEPFPGLAAASADARTAAEIVRSAPTSAEISAAGDWGYTLGSMMITSGETSTDANYLRLWRRSTGHGEWMLFLDTFAPMPAPQPTPPLPPPAGG